MKIRSPSDKHGSDKGSSEDSKGGIQIMVKTKIIETNEKYDKDGNLVEKITREETSEDDTDYVPTYPNFNGFAVHTNPPYYSYCGAKGDVENSYRGNITTGTVSCDKIKTGEIAGRLNFSGLKNKGETII